MGSTVLKWTAKFLFTVAGAIIVWAVKNLLVASVLQGWYHPRTSLGLGLLGGAVALVGWEIVVGVAALLFLCASVWHSAHRETFDRWIGAFARTWWRRWWTYSRVWERVLRRCGLTVEDGDKVLIPRLRGVATTPYWDLLELQMVEGQELDEYRQQAQKIRHAFRAQRALVREIEPAGVELALMRRDPFVGFTVPAAPIPATVDQVDFSRLFVGIDERGLPVHVSMVGGHTAVIGLSNAGKAGVQWNVMRQLGPAIGAGLVKPAFIDPKARELRQAREVLSSDEDYAVTEEEVIALLERLVAEMNAVNVSQGEQGERDFVPSTETPLRPIFIDELAPLLSLWSRQVRDKCTKALQLLLTQGRAAGYIVLACIQESTKDEFTIRDLFSRRIGLRLPTANYTNAALAEDAVDRGAECHKIPETLPGVAFSLRAEDSAATRLRLGYVRAEDIRELVQVVVRMRSVTNLADRRRAAGTDETTEEAA